MRKIYRGFFYCPCGKLHSYGGISTCPTCDRCLRCVIYFPCQKVHGTRLEDLPSWAQETIYRYAPGFMDYTFPKIQADSIGEDRYKIRINRDNGITHTYTVSQNGVR